MRVWDELQHCGTKFGCAGTSMSRSQSDNPWPRRLFEYAFFIVLIGTAWTLDTFTKMTERGFQGGNTDTFILYAHQVSSAIVVLSLVPFVAWWLSVFPLRRGNLLRAVPGHIIGHGLFAIAHYFLIVLLRLIIYPLFDREFIFSPFWVQNVLIEYQKDFKIYFAAVGVIAAYRYYRSQEANAVSTRADRLIVQTGSGETVIRQDDIEYLEAARNYVVVGTADKEYLIRETLGKLEKTLAPEQITRTHRSYLVHIDRIEEIRSTDSGSYEIRMKSGKRVPLSRGFRDSFRAIITS
jgi:hypothetical protein